MKKKITLILITFLLMFSMILPVYANEPAHVVDLADLLTDSEVQSLNERLNEISEQQQVDVSILTVTGIPNGYSVREYADTIYDSNGYGYGEDKDGLLLLISMEDRDWYITTRGYAITAFTDAGIQYIGSQIAPELSNASYDTAFEKYADLTDSFLSQARTGTPYDTKNLPKEPLGKKWLFISLGIGLVIAAIVVGNMVADMKTVHMENTAKNYMQKDSLRIINKSDRFMYHTINKTKRVKSSSGSSTHTSSSGSSHGGGGGKF